MGTFLTLVFMVTRILADCDTDDRFDMFGVHMCWPMSGSEPVPLTTVATSGHVALATLVRVEHSGAQC